MLVALFYYTNIISSGSWFSVILLGKIGRNKIAMNIIIINTIMFISIVPYLTDKGEHSVHTRYTKNGYIKPQM